MARKISENISQETPNYIRLLLLLDIRGKKKNIFTQKDTNHMIGISMNLKDQASNQQKLRNQLPPPFHFHGTLSLPMSHSHLGLTLTLDSPETKNGNLPMTRGGCRFKHFTGTRPLVYLFSYEEKEQKKLIVTQDTQFSKIN